MAAACGQSSRLLSRIYCKNGSVLKVSGKFYVTAPDWLGGKSKLIKSGKFDFPEHSESFDERMKIVESKKLESTNGDIKVPKNIGQNVTINRKLTKDTMMKLVVKNQRNNELEKDARLQTLTLPLDEVKAGWLKESGPQQIAISANHYGLYRDLFGGDYFYPTVNLDIFYEHSDEFFTPVCRGNIISPTEATKQPVVEFDSQSNNLWTLLMVNPDENLTNQEQEYVHWLVANIPGNDLSKGDVLVDYFQPIPSRGTGYHRNVFILFQQKEKMDYPELERINEGVSLDKRQFKTETFFKTHEANLVPLGLAFFQSQWDESVRHYFRNVLGIGEPSFEYQYPVPYHPPAKKYPHGQPFNIYFDRYRDSKDISEEVLRMKLKQATPFDSNTPQLRYPLAHMPRKYKPTWLIDKEEMMQRRVDQYKDLHYSVLRDE